MSRPEPDFSMEQLIEELRVPLPDIDEGGMRTVEIAAVFAFGETTVRKLLRG